MRVVIVDNHEMVRCGLRMMMTDHPEVRVVGEADNARTGLRIVEDLAPDVVLTEAELLGADGLHLCREVVGRGVDARVVLFTARGDDLAVSRALRAGASGYLLKQITASELVGALHQVRAGELVVDPRVAGDGAVTVTCDEAGDHRPGGRAGLTPRQGEILELIVLGMSKTAIASRLVVGEQTVKTHVRAIYRKLGVNDRDSAVTAALRRNLSY